MSFSDFLNSEKEKEPGFFNFEVLPQLASGAWRGIKTFAKNPVQTSGNIARGFGNWLDSTEVGQRSRARSAAAETPWQKYSAFSQNLADLSFTTGKTLLQEIGAGAVSITKTLTPDAQPGMPGYRTPEEQAQLERTLFGREAPSIGEGYSDPTMRYAEEQGSGAFEKYLLGGGAFIGGVALESPVGPPAKKPVKTLIKSWITKGAGKEEIEQGLRQAIPGISDDAAREGAQSIDMIINESVMKKSQQATEAQRMIDFLIEQNRRIPDSQPRSSVVQVVDTRTGRRTFYTVSPEDLRILSEDLIDGTKRGVAGTEINGKVYHLTAKTPEAMLERAGWKNGGAKELADIIEMIQPPKNRVPIRGEGGKFLGSFMMDEGSAYKLAADEITAERQLIDEIKRFQNADEFVTEVQSIASKMAKYQADPAALRKNVSRIEERLITRLRTVGDLPRVQAIRKTGIPDDQVLRDIYERLSSDVYKRPSLRSLAIDKQFNEVTSNLERIFGQRIPIVELQPTRRAGRQVLGRTDGTVIELLRKGNTVDQVVANHEGWHWFKRNLTPSKRKELDELEAWYAKREPERIAELKKDYPQGNMSDARYEKMIQEELMADEFANFYKTGRTKWQRVEDFFKNAMDALRTVFGFKRPIMDRVNREFRNVRKTLRDNRGKPKKSVAEKKIRTEGYEQAEMEMLAHLEYVGAGLKEMPDGSINRFTSISQWIPKEFRDADLINRVTTHIKNGTEPRANAKNEIALKSLVEEEIEKFSRNYETDEDVLTRLAAEAQEDFNVAAQREGTDPVGDLESLQQIAEQSGVKLPEVEPSKLETSPTVYDKKTKNAVVTTAQNLGETIPETVKRLEGIRRIKANVLEYVQNTDETMRLLMEDPAIKPNITDETNIYQKATLYHGKMWSLVENARAESEKVVTTIKDNAKYQGKKYDALKKEVNEYLVALHAPERNAIHGENAAGMTDAEAKAIVDRVNNSQYGEDVKRMAKQIQDINKKTLDTLLQGGVISEELHATLRETYKNHVPLYRVLENEEDFGSALAGKGFDVRSTGVKRAKGSDMEVDDILGNVIFNYEQAILRAEKNIVDNATLKFVRQNEKALDGLMKEVELPIVPVTTIEHKAQFSPEIRAAVRELIEKHGGEHIVKLKSGRNFGTYNAGNKEVMTRFGVGNDTLLHEFGHMLDLGIFNLGDSEFFDNAVSVELRKVADLRDGLDPNNLVRTKSRQNYVRKKEEKIAEFLAMYFTDYANAVEVAPITTKKFDAIVANNPDLQKLKGAMKSRVRAEERIEEIVFARQQFTNDPSILTLRENGKARYIKVEDPHLAVAIRGVGREKLGLLMQAIGTFTRFYSGLATRFNPDFALPNKIRDLQETVTYLASQPDMKAKGVLKTLKKDPASTKHVLDYLRGKDTEGARLYQEMKDAGGTTGGMGLSTRKQVELDIKKLEKLAKSPTRKTVNKLVEYVDGWNTIFEDSTRLSVYKAAREQGASIDRAAFLAKEASINFNRMGKGGPLINSLYMFSNASIQGSTKMIRALKNPKVAAGVATTIGVAVAATSEWNDQVDEDWRAKVPKWDRLNSLVVVLPSEDNDFHYVAIPVSWGLKPIKVMSDYAYDATSGHPSSAKDITAGVLTSIMEGYNPAGGSDLNSALMPTFLDVPYEIDRNRSWSGSMITPTNYNNAPDDALYFPSLPDTTTGRTVIALSELMAKGGIEVSPARMKYAFEQYIGGAGRFVSKIINAVAPTVTDQEPAPLDEYPFVGRFYRERTPEEQSYVKTASPEAALFEDLSKDDARARQKVRVQVDQLVREVEALATPQEKNARLQEIATQDPDIADKVMDKIEENQKGLTPDESHLKDATVAVRAQYIYQITQNMQTSQEKNEFLQEMVTKRIATDSVLDALEALEGNTKSPYQSEVTTQ